MRNEDSDREPQKRSYPKRSQWSEEDDREIMKLWEQYAPQLKKCRRNSYVYKTMSEQMNGKFSEKQIQVKIMSLVSRYSHERKKIVLRWEPSDWPLFDEVHQIYGRHKTYDFEATDDNSETRLNFPFVKSDTLVESLTPEEDFQPAEKKPENVFYKQNDLIAHSHDLLNTKRTSCPEENTSTHQSYQSTKAYKRFRRRMEKYENEQISRSALSKMPDTVNNVVDHIIKEDSGKSRNDPFYKLMDLYLLQLPERSQDMLKIKMLNMVYNEMNDKESIQEKNTTETNFNK